MGSPVVKSRNVLKRNSMRFAAALLAALASFVAGPTLAAAPQHHDQVPAFYRMKVGDLEVTALFDGTGVFDPHWLDDIDPAAAAATRTQLFSRLAREDVWIAEPHTSSFPGLGRLHKEGRGYSWAPVVFTDQWDER